MQQHLWSSRFIDVDWLWANTEADAGYTFETNLKHNIEIVCFPAAILLAVCILWVQLWDSHDGAFCIFFSQSYHTLQYIFLRLDNQVLWYSNVNNDPWCAFSSLQASWQKFQNLSHTLDNVIRKLFSKLVTWAIPGNKFLFKTCLQIYAAPVRFKKSMRMREKMNFKRQNKQERR